MVDIGNAIGNTPADNARMFAMASVSLADCDHCGLGHEVRGRSLAAHHGHPRRRRTTATRTRPQIRPGSIWVHLAAIPAAATDDFTPPFPAYVSGHATMGGAIFKSLELFYGTNDFAAADASIGADPVTGQYTLHSTEPGGGGVRETMSASRRLARSAPAWRTRPKAKTA